MVMSKRIYCVYLINYLQFIRSWGFDKKKDICLNLHILHQQRELVSKKLVQRMVILSKLKLNIKDMWWCVKIIEFRVFISQTDFSYTISENKVTLDRYIFWYSIIPNLTVIIHRNFRLHSEHLIFRSLLCYPTGYIFSFSQFAISCGYHPFRTVMDSHTWTKYFPSVSGFSMVT